jgi:hypothetical protein
MEYKGIEYNIRMRPEPNEWAWTIFPPKAKPIEGSVRGRRQRAIVAAHAAIDRWLRSRPAQSNQSSN